MKLKQLTIHNIASIEDAVIDFDGDILASQDLFLICGPTGSGKSTILDAICLVLFNKTPRMAGSHREALDDGTDNDTTGFTNDIRNLVRKNAVEAHVILTFEADGHEYRASWHARRTGQYRNGKETSTFAKLAREEKIKKRLDCEWMFADDEGHEYKKKVGEEIEKVIKMNFDQFCKTTMLAQGDFTKFLGSKSDEKAQILEKLVGTEQYARVGRVINRTFNDCKAELEVLKRELEGFIFLSDADRKAKEAEIRELDAQSKEIERQKAKTDDALRALKTIAECKEREAANVKCAEKLAGKYDEARRGTLHLIGKREMLAAANEALRQEIESRAQFEAMFAKADVICARHDAILANEKAIKAKTPIQQQCTDKLKQLEANAAELERHKQLALAEIESLEEDSKKRGARLQSLGAERLNEEVAQLNSRKNAVTEAANALQLLGEARTEAANRAENTIHAAKDLERYQAMEKEAAQTLLQAEKEALQSQETYDKAYLSLDNHARALRAKLTVGDDCPVCGRTIAQLLNEEELKKALKPLDEKRVADYAAAKLAAEANMQAVASTAAARKALDKARTEEKRAKDALEKRRESFDGKCRTLGIDAGENIQASLERIRLENEQTELELNRRQREIKMVRDHIDKNNALITSIRRERIAAIDRQIAANQTAAMQQQSELQQAAGAIENAKTAIERDRREITELVNPDWQPEQGADFYASLRTAAGCHADAKAKFESNARAIERTDSDLHSINSHRTVIEDTFPEWSNRATHDATEIPDILKFWNDLRTRAASLAGAIQETATHLDTAQKAIKDLQEELQQDLTRADFLELQTAALGDKSRACSEMKGRLQNELKTDEENRRRQGRKKAEFDAKLAETAEWETLNKYLGSTDGKNFRNVAQSFILNELLDKANAYLENISTRYTLFCNPGTLTIQIYDAYQGGAGRPISTLSGGESFIISLSLALGLSSMQNVDFEVDTLFIDEGFGTLSPEYLDPVITALKRLNETYGRRVGIISHVDSLKQRIPASIQVSRQGTSPSKIEVKLS